MKLNAGELLFKQDDPFDGRVFVILSGKIRILCQIDLDLIAAEKYKKLKPDDNSQDISKTLIAKKAAHYLKKTKDMKIEEGKLISEAKLKEFEGKFGKKIRDMDAGETVGEKALIEEKPRSATIFTYTSCEFLIIEKEFILSALEEIKENIKKADRMRKEVLYDIFGKLVNNYSSKIFDNVIYSFSVHFILIIKIIILF